MNIQQLFKRKVQPSAIPHCNEREFRAAHMSKSAFVALLASDALYALRTNDSAAYNMLLDEIAYVDEMSRGEYAFYCWQRASNASYSYSPDLTGNVQLSLF